MCWIEIPNRAVCDEVQARLDADPLAVVVVDSRCSVTALRLAVALAFAVGVAVGWLWR